MTWISPHLGQRDEGGWGMASGEQETVKGEGALGPVAREREEGKCWRGPE